MRFFLVFPFGALGFLVYIVYDINTTPYSASKDPRYIAGDTIAYKVDPFYKNVCSGKGIVIKKSTYKDVVYYYIKIPSSEMDAGCPFSDTNLTYSRTDTMRIAYKRVK